MESKLAVKVGQFDCITVATVRVPNLKGGASYQSVIRELEARAHATLGLHLLIDFSGVSEVSADFLAHLTILRRAVETEGGTLRFCNLPQEVHHALEAHGLECMYLADGTRQALMKYIRELGMARTRPLLSFTQRCAVAEWPGISFRVTTREAKKGSVR